MIQRLKVVEKEKEGLESKKQEAEDFMDKQAQMLTHRATAALIHAAKYKVRELIFLFHKCCSCCVSVEVWSGGCRLLPFVCHQSCLFQAVLEENTKKRGELEAKLNHERDKSQNFDLESKELERKFAQADKEHQVGNFRSSRKVDSRC